MRRRKRIDPRIIGAFVLGAIILSVSGLIFFGPGGLLTETRKYVIYFSGSVKGLNVGSPVRFRGVKIGQVKDINVRIQPSEYTFNIPVFIEIEPSRIKSEGGNEGLLDALKTNKDPMTSLVDKGLRAQLQLDSLVTGQLYVNLDMHPDTDAKFHSISNEFPELPAISSSLDELSETIEELPLKEIASKLISTADGIEAIVTSPGLHKAIDNVGNSAEQLDLMIRELNRQLIPMVTSLKNTVEQAELTMTKLDARIEPLADSLDATLSQTRGTMAHIDSKIDPLDDQLQKTLQAFETTAKQAGIAVEQIRELSGTDSQLIDQLSVTLQEVNKAARKVAYFADELERDPQILLRGRSQGDTP
ncbi:MAG: hypothetical protein C0622_14960 [Desulfuromonas sp.]|nr:MAG: hypothetical protein C0622_14960 [Desulfuromonas sp.]